MTTASQLLFPNFYFPIRVPRRVVDHTDCWLVSKPHPFCLSRPLTLKHSRTIVVVSHHFILTPPVQHRMLRRASSPLLLFRWKGSDGRDRVMTTPQQHIENRRNRKLRDIRDARAPIHQMMKANYVWFDARRSSKGAPWRRPLTSPLSTLTPAPIPFNRSVAALQQLHRGIEVAEQRGHGGTRNDESSSSHPTAVVESLLTPFWWLAPRTTWPSPWNPTVTDSERAEAYGILTADATRLTADDVVLLSPSQLEVLLEAYVKLNLHDPLVAAGLAAALPEAAFTVEDHARWGRLLCGVVTGLSLPRCVAAEGAAMDLPSPSSVPPAATADVFLETVDQWASMADQLWGVRGGRQRIALRTAAALQRRRSIPRATEFGKGHNAGGPLVADVNVLYATFLYGGRRPFGSDSPEEGARFTSPSPQTNFGNAQLVLPPPHVHPILYASLHSYSVLWYGMALSERWEAIRAFLTAPSTCGAGVDIDSGDTVRLRLAAQTLDLVAGHAVPFLRCLSLARVRGEEASLDTCTIAVSALQHLAEVLRLVTGMIGRHGQRMPTVAPAVFVLAVAVSAEVVKAAAALHRTPARPPAGDVGLPSRTGPSQLVTTVRPPRLLPDGEWSTVTSRRRSQPPPRDKQDGGPLPPMLTESKQPVLLDALQVATEAAVQSVAAVAAAIRKSPPCLPARQLLWLSAAFDDYVAGCAAHVPAATRNPAEGSTAIMEEAEVMAAMLRKAASQPVGDLTRDGTRSAASTSR
mgnify:CR=1 FL=1